MSSDFFYDNFSVFGHIEISLSGQDCVGDIYSASNSRKLSWKKFHDYMYLACEFIAHYTCRNAEMNLE